jgi:hypothetical protein
MIVVRAGILGALVAACSQAGAPAPAPAPTSAPAPAETCLLGQFQAFEQQRMTHDVGVTTLLEDQHVGEVSVLFASQRATLRRSRLPPTLLLLVGSEVTETLEDLEYVPHPDGAKPTQTRTTSKAYTFFVAEKAWDCGPVAAELTGLPQGRVDAAACVPAALRARCAPVDPTAG